MTEQLARDIFIACLPLDGYIHTFKITARASSLQFRWYTWAKLSETNTSRMYESRPHGFDRSISMFTHERETSIEYVKYRIMRSVNVSDDEAAILKGHRSIGGMTITIPRIQ